MTNSPNKIIWLFGAGISRPYGVASSDQITETILNYSKYCPSDNSTRIENLLRNLHVKIALSRDTKTDNVNFEDLLGALLDLVSGSMSPLASFDQQESKIIAELTQGTSLANIYSKMYLLLREMIIHDNSFTKLENFDELLREDPPHNLFTLNYDTIIESLLKYLTMTYTTGFDYKTIVSFP